MAVKPIIIDKDTPKAGVGATPDGITGFITNGVAVAGKLVLGTVYKIQSLKDANALGLDDDYDTTNSVLVYYHLKEFYLQTPDRAQTPVFILVLAQTVKLSDMVDVDGVHAKKLINFAKGTIRLLMAAYNPTTYTPTQLNGLDSDTVIAIAKAQVLSDYCFTETQPIRVFLEGKSFSGAASAAQDLRAIASVVAPNVSLVIAQDLNKASQNALWAKHAAVGTFTGAVANRSVHENPAWVEVGNITDVSRGRWINPGLSSGLPIDNYKDDWQILDTKGYIFPITYNNAEGVYFNDDHTCTPIVSDPENNTLNEFNVHYGRTIDKAALNLYAALLPKVKSPQPVDGATGKLPQGVVAYFQGLVENRINQNMRGEISALDVFVDKDSDLINAPKQLNASVSVVPIGSTDVINVKLALKSKI